MITDPAAEKLDGALIDAFRAAMDDDLGTPTALAAIFDGVRAANAVLDAGELIAARAFVATVVSLAAALGLHIEDPRRAEQGDDDEIDRLVAARETARTSKHFAAADRIRVDLTARGIVIEDTASGPIWRRP